MKEERGRGLPLSLQSLQGSSTVDSGKLVLMLLGPICACFVTLKRNQLGSHGGDHRVSHNAQRARHTHTHAHTETHQDRGLSYGTHVVFVYMLSPVSLRNQTIQHRRKELKVVVAKVSCALNTLFVGSFSPPSSEPDHCPTQSLKASSEPDHCSPL